LRIDPRDQRRHPDVRVDLAIHPFQLVEPVDRRAIVADVDPPPLLQRRGIEEAQLVAAVAHDDLAAILGEAPAFALVAPFGEAAERAAVPAIADLVLPGDVDDLVAPVDDALAELAGRYVDRLEHVAGLQID